MRTSNKVDNIVYKPQETPDITERLSKETREREYKEGKARIERIHKEKRDLIKTIHVDRKIYTVNTIIEFVEAGKYTIPYSFFPYHISEQQLFNIFLEKLKSSGCFSSYTTNPFKDAYHTEFIFDGVNISELIKQRLLIDGKKISNSMLNQSSQSIAHIYYNEESGLGYVNERRFKFKDHRPEYRIFSELYTRLNKKVERAKILELLNYMSDDKNLGSASHNDETIQINEVVTVMREKTGLNKDQLVNNNGNITLSGRKLKYPPVINH